MIKDVYTKAKKFITVILREDVFGSAAEMSYMLTLSVFPLLLSFMAIFSIVGNTAFVNEALNTLSQFAPAEVINVIQTVLKEVTLDKPKAGVFDYEFTLPQSASLGEYTIELGYDKKEVLSSTKFTVAAFKPSSINARFVSKDTILKANDALKLHTTKKQLPMLVSDDVVETLDDEKAAKKSAEICAKKLEKVYLSLQKQYPGQEELDVYYDEK